MADSHWVITWRRSRGEGAPIRDIVFSGQNSVNNRDIIVG